jgi:hypothetical protein
MIHCNSQSIIITFYGSEQDLLRAKKIKQMYDIPLEEQLF